MTKKLANVKLFLLLLLCWYGIFALDQGYFLISEWGEGSRQSVATWTVLNYILLKLTK